MLKYYEDKSGKALSIADNVIDNLSAIKEDRHIIIAENQEKEIYLVSNELLRLFYFISPKKHPYLIGLYFGKINKEFKPSFEALFRFAKISKKQKVIISRKEEMRFLYGRDIRASQLREYDKNLKEGDFAVICNKNNESIGFGKIIKDLRISQRSEIVIKNIMDRGVYLR